MVSNIAVEYEYFLNRSVFRVSEFLCSMYICYEHSNVRFTYPYLAMVHLDLARKLRIYGP